MLMALAIRLLGIGRMVAEFFKRNPLLLACLILAFWGLYQRHEATKWHTTAARYADTLKQAEIASKAELARANAEHAAALKKQKDDDDATDKRVAAAGAADAARLNAHIGRLRAALGSRGTGQVPPAGPADLAEGDQRPGEGSKLDDTLTSDLTICTENTRRLLEAHKEAIGQ